MSTTRKRILFLAEGITMAHFTRPAVLAQTLDPAEWDVHFWTPARYHPLLPPAVSHIGTLQTLDPARFLELLASGSVLYSAATLREYIQDDLAIIRDVQPDLIVGDYRLSLCVSAPLAGVPFAAIFNAYWSPYRHQPAIVPMLPVTRWISPALLNPLYALLRPLFLAYHGRALNTVRREHGLPPLARDMRGQYATGDLVLYPDVPELVPVSGAPATHHYVGTCGWSAPVAKPAWWEPVMESPVPKVFVALGSSGPLEVLPAVLEALSGLSVQVVVATSGRAVGTLPANVHTADLLPFEDTARHSALVVSHGGSSGVYPALSAGAPVLAIPANIDTHLSAAVLDESGAGLIVRAERASVRAVRAAAARLLGEAQFRQKAATYADVIARYDAAIIFPRLLRKWFTSH